MRAEAEVNSPRQVKPALILLYGILETKYFKMNGRLVILGPAGGLLVTSLQPHSTRMWGCLSMVSRVNEVISLVANARNTRIISVFKQAFCFFEHQDCFPSRAWQFPL